jgi:hypothetical protein
MNYKLAFGSFSKLNVSSETVILCFSTNYEPQTVNYRLASGKLMEQSGLEPPTCTLRRYRSPN